MMGMDCSLFNLGFLRIAETGGADHHGDAQAGAHIQMRHGSFGPREINQKRAARQRLLHIRLNRNTRGLAAEGRGVLAQRRAAGHV